MRGLKTKVTELQDAIVAGTANAETIKQQKVVQDPNQKAIKQDEVYKGLFTYYVSQFLAASIVCLDNN